MEILLCKHVDLSIYIVGKREREKLVIGRDIQNSMGKEIKHSVRRYLNFVMLDCLLVCLGRFYNL